MLALQLLFVFLYNIPDIGDYLLGPLVLIFPFAAWVIATPQPLIERIARGFSAGEIEWRSQRIAVIVAALLLAAAFATNRQSIPPPTASFAEAWRERFFQALPEGAGVITAKDADIYTIWYTQFAEGRRRDVMAYGGNFNRFPWTRMTFPPDDPRREAVSFSEGAPTTLEDYVNNLSEDAIKPMLAHGRVFLMVNHPMEAEALARRYQVLPAARLLTQQELESVFAAGQVNFPPPILYEIKPKDAP